jgi:hypothetical protein
MIDLSYIPQGKLIRLNEYVARHTQFINFEDLVSMDNNFRPTYYVDVSVPNLVQMELKELAEYYDAHMIKTYDPRRIYYA